MRSLSKQCWSPGAEGGPTAPGDRYLTDVSFCYHSVIPEIASEIYTATFGQPDGLTRRFSALAQAPAQLSQKALQCSPS